MREQGRHWQGAQPAVCACVDTLEKIRVFRSALREECLVIQTMTDLLCGNVLPEEEKQSGVGISAEESVEELEGIRTEYKYLFSITIYMENECKLFSSRGLLKSCCMHADNVEQVGPHALTYRVNKINVRLRKTPSVYINIASLDFFCKNILPSLKAPVVLVIGDSDVAVPNTMFTQNFVVQLLGHPKIKRWYCQNLCCRAGQLFSP